MLLCLERDAARVVGLSVEMWVPSRPRLKMALF